MTKTIELENLRRIKYRIDDTDEESPFRMLAWEEDEYLGNRWKRYISDYYGTMWYGPYKIDLEAEKQIRSRLEPVATMLGIDLIPGSLFAVNVRKLVEIAASKVETVKESGLKGVYSKEATIAIYQMPDGRIIRLKNPKIF